MLNIIPSKLFKVTFLVSFSIFLPISQLYAAPQAKFVADELLVQFVAGVPQEKATEVLKGHGLKEADEISPIRVKRIKVTPQSMANIKKALAKNPHVKFVENNFTAEGGSVPNDPTYVSQWHLPKISAPQGWDISTGSATTDIAIIDSGIDPTHPDLASKLIPGYNFLNGTTDTHDVLGHGTAVAGTAAAISNNGKGVAGVAWQSSIMPLVVLDATDYASYSNIANAIIYAADHGVRIINVSIGGASASSTLQNAVNYAWNKGALVFASAMNNGTTTPYYPAACTNAIAVAATDSADNRSSFSNYGTWITIAAPGSYIYTTNNGGGYGAWNGTSFSSPIAAGLAALILSVNPMLTNQQVKDIIIQNVDDLGTAGFDQNFGYGRINVAKSLQAAQAYVMPSDTIPPTVAIASPANGTTLKGAVTVNVTASDNVGITKVEMYLNGTLIGTDMTAPFAFYWDTTTTADGNYQLEARAYDAAGNMSSTSAAVVVLNAVDTVPPIVSIQSPVNGTSIASVSTVTVKASATDNVSVTRMELYIDGSLKSSASSSALSYNWNVKKLTAGTHAIKVKAFDAAGNVAETVTNVTR